MFILADKEIINERIQRRFRAYLHKLLEVFYGKFVPNDMYINQMVDRKPNLIYHPSTKVQNIVEM